MNKPRVTVYIVNHNYEAYLLQAYYSVRYQSYRNIELIIIDNNSEKDSRDLLKKISIQDGVDVIFRKQSDLISACNVALSRATGEYIVRLDADDYFRKDAIEKLVNVITEHNADLVYPEYFEITSNGNVINRVKHINFDDHVSLPYFPAHGACTLVSVDALNSIGGYDEEFDRQDGYYLWIRFLINRYKIINTNYPLFFYRIHENSLSHNLSNLYEVRSRISNKVLNLSELEKPSIDCVIPLMENDFDHSVFYGVINELMKSDVFRKIIVWASFNIELSEDHSDVIIIDRKYKVEFEEKIIGPAVSDDLSVYYDSGAKPDYVFFRTLNTPNVKHHYFSQMRFLISLFRHVDCVVGAVPTKEIFYSFNGDSLEPVRDEDFVRNERNALYRKIRGFTLIRFDTLMDTRKLVAGVISPILISSEDAFDKYYLR